MTAFDLVLFGGTGDLAMRKLLPALYQRHRDTADAAGWRIIAVGRHPITREQFLAKLHDKHGMATTHAREYHAALAMIDAHCELWTPEAAATEETAA